MRTPDPVPPAPDTETWAWTHVTGSDGRILRSNSFDHLPEGCAFLAVFDAAGHQLGWWATSRWKENPEVAVADMRALGVALCGANVVLDPEFGEERFFDLAGGQMRFEIGGTYVRFVDSSGEGVDGGSAYWVFDEWTEDPMLVAGAIVGAAVELAG